jgi:hypothetical protein
LAIFGDIWRYLVIFGDIWRYLAIFGDIWRYLAIFGDTLKSFLKSIFFVKKNMLTKFQLYTEFSALWVDTQYLTFILKKSPLETENGHFKNVQNNFYGGGGGEIDKNFKGLAK